MESLIPILVSVDMAVPRSLRGVDGALAHSELGGWGLGRI
jgi:hypothetical protein